MSNPSICYLSQTQINGIYFAVEDNLGEAVHIHYADIRIDMTIAEFIKFSDCVIDAARELFSLRNIDWDLFDIESIKEEWVTNYNHISAVELAEVSLDSLFMKESYVKKRSIKRFIPLKESGYINYFSGNSNDELYYDEAGIYEPSRGDKARKIENVIKELGYPYDEKRIVIDQEGYILDGLKRASCLYYLFGGSYKVPVVIVNMLWKESLESRRLKAEKAVSEYELNIISEEKKKESKKVNTDKIIKFDEIIEVLTKIKADYVVLKDIEYQTLDAYAFIIVEKRLLKELQERINGVDHLDEMSKKLIFAYSVNSPLIYRTDLGLVIIHEKYFVKSRFVKDTYIPLDRKIQKWIWNECQSDSGQKIHELKEWNKTFLVIIQSVLNGKMIPLRYMCVIENNKQMLQDKKYMELLESVFFMYSDHLVKCLVEKDYAAAINDYVPFGEY